MPMIPTTRKGLSTRRNILQAASRVFARLGYVETRMIDVAIESGISTGGLYRYFDNKTDLFAAVVADIHEEFFELSGHTRHILVDDPLAALTEANRGYIEHYYKNRDVMRAFIEAAAIEKQFAIILRTMRNRHVKRFAAAYNALRGRGEVLGVPVEVATEAMSCMIEHCCYVWFAQEGDCETVVSPQQAIEITSRAWYATMFASRAPKNLLDAGEFDRTTKDRS